MEALTSNEPINEVEMRAALARVLGSRALRASRRLCRFLEYTVGGLLAGRMEELKESVIGTAVYDRPATYEKSEDSIVRTEARRLRSKLAEYYADEGRDDPVRVLFSPGSYVPTFQRHHAPTRPADAADAVAQSAHPVPAGRGEGVLVAILPLVDLSGSSFSTRCARLLTEALTDGWSHVEGVRVVSIDAFPPTLLSGEQSAEPRRRGVEVVFAGSVWEEDGGLRVTLRLMQPNGLLISSQRFEGQADPSGLHLLTDRLASALISRLHPERSEIRKGGQPIIAEDLPMLPTLYEAEALLDEATGEDLQVPAAKFQDVTRALPHFARPLCGLANCYCLAALYGVAGSGGLVQRAAELARRAVELDCEMVLAWTTRGYTHLFSWEWSEAERCFRQALASGDHAVVCRQYALFLIATERFDEAEFLIEKAQRLDPFSGKQKMVRSLFFRFTRRTEELRGLTAEDNAFGTRPAVARLLLAFSHVEERRFDEAKRIALSCRKTVGGQPNLMALVAEVLALCGDGEQARHIAKVFGLLSPASPINLYRRALLTMALGQIEEAWTLLLKAVDEQEPELVWLKVEPRLDPFRGDARFKSVLATVMFPGTSSGVADTGKPG